MKGYSFGELVKLAEAALPRTDNAVSASKLQTARTINGTSFDGTAAITTANWGTARTLTIGNSGKSVNGGGNVSWSLTEIGALPSSANAVSATKLATPRQINGTNFDGTANITTANWGTARTLTIGNTGKSVNGGANVAWSLAEMGALPLTGGKLTGDLTFSMDSELSWFRNTDYAKIGFKNTADNDTDSYMWFKTGDNGNEYFKWQGVSGSTITDWMALKSSGLTVAGTITALTFSGALSGNAATATKLVTPRAINGTNFDGTANITTANWGTARTLTIGSTGKSVNGSGNVAWSLAEIGAVNKAGDTMTGNLTISNGAPQFIFNETDASNKKYIMVADGGGIRLNSDNTVGKVVWSWNGTTLSTGGTLNEGGNRVYSAGNNNIGTGATNYAAGNHTHSYFSGVDTALLGNGVTYTNTTGRPMFLTVKAYGVNDVSFTVDLRVNGAVRVTFGRGNLSGGRTWNSSGSIMIPAGATYAYSGTSANVTYTTTRFV